MPDAIEMLVAQHREVEELFHRMEGLQVAAVTDHEEGKLDERTKVTNTIVEKLSQHAAVEELHFYPAIREAGADDLAARAEGEQQHVKDLLQYIDGMSPDHTDFDPTLREIIADVRAHVAYEEGEVFPEMRERLGGDALDQIGGKLAAAMKHAPTHPHAHTPVNKATAALGGVMDRLRDGLEHKKTAG